jgi:hypothetical protein
MKPKIDKQNKREPKRFPGQFINPPIPGRYKMSNDLDYRDQIKDIKREFLIKTGILVGNDLRTQRSQPNSINHAYKISRSRKLKHQKLTNKYE